MSSVTTENLNLPEWVPVLVIVPASVLPTWIAQFDRWGYFGVGAYQYQQRSIALESVRSGYNEILVSGIPLFNQEEGFRELSSLNWKLIIVDEYHQCKVSLRFLFARAQFSSAYK
jgi:RecG-like helicase